MDIVLQWGSVEPAGRAAAARQDYRGQAFSIRRLSLASSISAGMLAS